MDNHVAIIAHGRLHSHRTLRSVAERYGLLPLLTTSPLHATHLAASLHADVREVIVVGGDGTLHEVVNGVMQIEERKRPVISVLPLGSGNDTYRTLTALDADTSHAWDVLRIGFIGPDGERGERYCINVADAGLGGHVVRHYTDRLRKLPGKFGYGAAIWQGFRAARAQYTEVQLFGGETESTDSSRESVVRGNMLLVAFANGRWFGSGIGIAPHSAPADGKMALTMIGDVSVATYLRYLPQLAAGRRIKDARATYTEAVRCVVATERAVPVEIDGEYVGTTPASAEVVPNALQIRAYSAGRA